MAATTSPSSSSSSSSTPVFFSFGEAMVRFAPVPEPYNLPGASADVSPFWRSVGGDELNVSVALARLGVRSNWTSVLGEGPDAKFVLRAGLNAGVLMNHVPIIEGERTATFLVIPEEKRVHYSRKDSAFAKHNPKLFDWPKLLAGCSWLHMTGITPLLGPSALSSWQRALDTAIAQGTPCSIDFNHRPALGTLTTLWSYVRPYVSRVRLMVLSCDQVLGLARLEDVSAAAAVAATGGSSSSSSSSSADALEDILIKDHSHAAWHPLLIALQRKLRTPWLICCFKTRSADGVQRRWSSVATAERLFTTNAIPTMHRVKDEVGGGSAYFAGVCHFLMHEGAGASSVSESIAMGALRRGDLLAALCQETVGDFSHVTAPELAAVQTKYAGKTAYIAEVETAFLSGVAVTTLQDKLADSLRRVINAKVIAIIRAPLNAQGAIERGLELAAMGARALEVTLDTQDWKRVLTTLIKSVPSTCLVGVGTVFDQSQLAAVAATGARFALSPINPPGFIAECLRLGILPVPAAFSPNEVYSMYKTGAQLIKLFPAHLYTPDIVKAIKEVGDFSKVHLLPSGGVSPSTFPTWLAAGASAVGMGGNLSGTDLKFPYGSTEFNTARDLWNKEGRARAAQVFAQVAASDAPATPRARL